MGRAGLKASVRAALKELGFSRAGSRLKGLSSRAKRGTYSRFEAKMMGSAPLPILDESAVSGRKCRSLSSASLRSG